MTADATREDLAAVLEWYRAMGVETVEDEVPVDWLARGDTAPGREVTLAIREAAAPTMSTAPAPPAAPAANARSSASRPPQLAPPAASPPSVQNPKVFEPRRPPPVVASPDAAETAARAAARPCNSLDELEAALKVFDGCGLKATAKNLCFYRGAKETRLMLIGEAPGRDEDIEGKPFVGRAGQLLDKMLAAIQLGEDDIHITNIVYWRPPGNRTPTPAEAQACRPFLERQVEIVAPDIIVVLGGAAAKVVLDVSEGIMRTRGKWREVTMGSHTARAMATLHPAYLLRTPSAKRQAWRDFLAIKAALAK